MANLTTNPLQKPSYDKMMEEYLALKAENERLKANKTTTNGIKLSAKGAVSVYGLGRFPVTLYASQWQTLLALAPDIQAFMEANKANLATKEQ